MAGPEPFTLHRRGFKDLRVALHVVNTSTWAVEDGGTKARTERIDWFV